VATLEEGDPEEESPAPTQRVIRPISELFHRGEIIVNPFGEASIVRGRLYAEYNGYMRPFDGGNVTTPSSDDDVDDDDDDRNQAKASAAADRVSSVNQVGNKHSRAPVIKTGARAIPIKKVDNGSNTPPVRKVQTSSATANGSSVAHAPDSIAFPDDNTHWFVKCFPWVIGVHALAVVIYKANPTEVLVFGLLASRCPSRLSAAWCLVVAAFVVTVRDESWMNAVLVSTWLATMTAVWFYILDSFRLVRDLKDQAVNRKPGSM
jgi:hypothetical protein